MKFINYLQTITGVSIYPMISLILFVAVFAFALFYVIKTDKKTIEEQSQLPLD